RNAPAAASPSWTSPAPRAPWACARTGWPATACTPPAWPTPTGPRWHCRWPPACWARRHSAGSGPPLHRSVAGSHRVFRAGGARRRRMAASLRSTAMSLAPDTRTRIETLLSEHRVVLFMKGNPQAPQCGFSAKAAGILNGLIEAYAHVDVLQDAEIREGIKAYGQWPTIPQLYVGGELVGGSDIIEQMLNSGELHTLLGLPEPDRTPPQIHISERAAEAIRGALENAEEGLVLHLSVDPRFNARFELRPASGHEVVAQSNGIRVHFDLASAPRARGLKVDWVEDARGAGLVIDNPNAPPPVKALTVKE